MCLFYENLPFDKALSGVVPEYAVLESSDMSAFAGKLVAERKKNAAVKVPKIPKGVTLKEFDLNGFSADDIRKQGNDKGLIFYIHGAVLRPVLPGKEGSERIILSIITAMTAFRSIIPLLRKTSGRHISKTVIKLMKTC